MPQDLGTRQLGDLLPLGQSGRSLLEVDSIDRHPSATRLQQRPCLRGETGDVCRRQLDVVEQDAPRDVAQLVCPHLGPGAGLGEQVEGGPGRTTGKFGGSHFEADRGESRTGLGHELPRFGLAEDHLTAALHACPTQCGEGSFESRPLRSDHAASLACLQRGVDRNELARSDSRVHRRHPQTLRAGRFELDDERAASFGDGARPLVQPARSVTRQVAIGREDFAVHPGHNRVGEVSR